MSERLPLLHVVTDDAVLARTDFPDRARALLAIGPSVAVHLRGRRTGGARLFELARALVGQGRVVVNDRVDVAEGAGAWGVQLPASGLPVEVARRLAGPKLRLGASVHDRTEASDAAAADWWTVGTLWSTPSHPDAEASGPALLGTVAAVGRTPLVAIGGVTPERVTEVVAAGASAVAAIRGVWEADDPVAAARLYLDAFEAAGIHERRTSPNP